MSASSSYQNYISSHQKAKSTQGFFYCRTFKCNYVKNFKSDIFLGGREYLQISDLSCYRLSKLFDNEAAVSVQSITKHGS